MKAACLALFLALLAASFPVRSQERGVSYTVTGGGALSFAHILNDRVDNGVSSSGVEFRGQLELGITGIIPSARLRTTLTAADLLLPGTANVFGGGLFVQYAKDFRFLDRSWTVGAGIGPAYVFAPTKDAGSTWWALGFKADLRTQIAGLSMGLTVTVQQLLMPDVEDPLFVTVGVEVLTSLFGDPPPRPEPVRLEPVSTPTKKPPVPLVVANPLDTDGDGIPNAKDRCPSTRKGQKVESNGCRPISDGMIFPDLTFVSQKSLLNPGAKKELVRLAEILDANESIIVVISVVARDAMLAKKRADIIEMELQLLKIPGTRIKTAPQVGMTEAVSFNFRLGL